MGTRILVIMLAVVVLVAVVVGCSNRSPYVGTWQTADHGRTLILNADGTALVPTSGSFEEHRFKWSADGDRVVFDGWVKQKGYGFGFLYAKMEGSDTIVLCDEAGNPGDNQTWLRAK